MSSTTATVPDTPPLVDSAPAPTPAPAPAPAVSAEAPPPAAPELSAAACATQLAALFPAVFGPGTPPRPLKLRIQIDIQQRAPGSFTKKALSHFLQRHTTSTAYLKALVNAPHRLDLDGAPAGEPADEHRQAAVAELQRRRALHDARRAAERDAQRGAQREAERKAQDEARRAWEADAQARGERDGLLRAFEATTLTRKNFCALKGVTEAALDALLAQARLERQRQPAQAPRPERRPEQRPAGSGARPGRGGPAAHRHAQGSGKPG